MNGYNFVADRPISETRSVDVVFLIFVMLLWGLGIFTLMVCSENVGIRLFNDQFYFVKRQLINSFIAFCIFAFFARVKMSVIRKFLPFIVLGTLFLCLLTFVPGIGIEKKGSARWIRFPFFSSFQPSEFAKFAIVLFLANYFDKESHIENPKERSIFAAVIGLLIFVVIIFLQKDFSTCVFVFSLGIILFFVTGAKLYWLIPFSMLVIPASFLMISLEQYCMNRLIAFLNPAEDLQGINYQSFAARRAINAGGFWGEGIGVGLTKINGVPEIQSDYIFVGWVESIGFLGVVIYFALLLVFAIRSYKIAFCCKDRFASIGAFGCASAIFLQSLINCAVVGGVLPNTGIPLPFFSAGGTSLIVTFAMCGFILNASHSKINSKSISESVYGVSSYE